MKGNKIAFALMAAIGISASAYLWAGSGDACHVDPQARVQKQVDDLAKKLKLTDEQKAKVQEAISANQQKMEEVHKQMMELHQSSKAGIEAVLTPEQKEKFAKMNKGKDGCCGEKECMMKK